MGSATNRRPLSLTPKQLEERRLKNQCFWCEEKFIPGHKCKNRHLYLLTVQDDDMEIEEETKKDKVMAKEEGEVMSNSNPYLSLHALEGTFNYQTMRLRGSVRKKMLNILIDTGSTHNFISCEMAIKLGCVMETVAELKVSAANGEELKCNAVCKQFKWVMQGQLFVADVLA